MLGGGDLPTRAHESGHRADAERHSLAWILFVWTIPPSSIWQFAVGLAIVCWIGVRRAHFRSGRGGSPIGMFFVWMMAMHVLLVRAIDEL